MNLETILATLVGAMLGWLANWYFSWRGGSELRAEAARLRAETALVRQAVNVLGRAMEAANWATIARDADGTMIGLVFTGEAALEVRAGLLRGEGTVTPSDTPPADAQ